MLGNLSRRVCVKAIKTRPVCVLTNQIRSYAGEEQPKTAEVNKAPKQRRAAFILSGCGTLDGSDPVEAVSLMIACGQNKVDNAYFTVYNKEIEDCFLHTTREIDPKEERITQKESARIIRAAPQNLERLDASQYDLLVIPGGNGNVRTLLTLEQHLDELDEVVIDAKVKQTIQAFHQAKKPIVASSNAVVLLSKALEGSQLALSVGKFTDKPLVDYVENTTGKPVEVSDATQPKVDRENAIVTLASTNAVSNVNFNEIFDGAREAIKSAIGLLKQ
ncbi:hypothetical protein AKO1_008098 [Acrasis kona]|uniref:Uncharacterized protein n=1 Tax=Acrasis kona TaxID=1008807 RepID=A0AAW2YSY7_9EUKA